MKKIYSIPSIKSMIVSSDAILTSSTVEYEDTYSYSVISGNEDGPGVGGFGSGEAEWYISFSFEKKRFYEGVFKYAHPLFCMLGMSIV